MTPDHDAGGQISASAWKRWQQALVADLLGGPRHVLVLRLTLLLLLLYGTSTLALDVPVRVVCSLMLLSPFLLTNPAMWVVLCGLMWWVNATDWLWIDNHQFLISYWCLVCALGVSAKSPDSVLAHNGRWLVGLTFLFATVWKILAGEYWDGSFLHYTFLTDDRVEAIAAAVGGLNPDVLLRNQLLESMVAQVPHEAVGVTLTSSPRLYGFAIVASYWTVAIEAAVAAAFLLSPVRWLFRLRHGLLMVFIVTTYFVLPVLGFAYILIVMGLAQCTARQSRTGLAYLLLFGLLQLARLPWETLLVS